MANLATALISLKAAEVLGTLVALIVIPLFVLQRRG